MAYIPDEVKKAGAKVDNFLQQNALDLAAIKGDSEDSPTRAAAAVAMKIDGAGYSDIARVLEYSSAQRARKAVEEAIAAQAGTPDQLEHIRWVNSRRIERIIASIMPRATNPKDPDHLMYARMAIVTIDRHLRIWGADAPQKVDVTYSPAAGEIERWAMSLAATVHGPQAEEGNIMQIGNVIDAEIVEDEEEDK